MAITRTKNKIQFVQDILSVFTAFRHSGRGYLDYLRQSKGGDEFDVRDMIVEPYFRKAENFLILLLIFYRLSAF